MTARASLPVSARTAGRGPSARTTAAGPRRPGAGRSGPALGRSHTAERQSGSNRACRHSPYGRRSLSRDPGRVADRPYRPQRRGSRDRRPRHLIGHRLRTPDPWAAVRHRFAATGLDPALTSTPGHRDVAIGLLAAAPPDGWPPAPAGVTHPRPRFRRGRRCAPGLYRPGDRHVQRAAWTAEPELAGAYLDLRTLAGDPLTDAVLDWAAEPVRGLAGSLRMLRAAARHAMCVPLGLVAGLLAEATG